MFVKICGMTRQQDLDLASSLGANLCGFIFAQKSPRFITPGAAAALDSHGMARVGVFLTDDSGFILRTAAEARLDFIQLHGRQSSATALAAGRHASSAYSGPEPIRMRSPSRRISTKPPGKAPSCSSTRGSRDPVARERAFSGHASAECISPCPGFFPEASHRKARLISLFWRTGRTVWTSIPARGRLRASRTPGS